MHVKGEFVPMSECTHGALYRILADNLKMGVYDEKTQSFVGLRKKYGEEYLNSEFHVQCDGGKGTAFALEMLETCPYQPSVDSVPLFYWLRLKRSQHADRSNA